MKKQFFTILLSITLLNVFAAQKYVTINGNNSTNDGSILKPWATIAHAISQVNNGDTINIGVGTFAEHSILLKKPVTIQGVSANYTIIQANTTTPTAGILTNVVFDIQANVTISGLTIRYGSPGINIGSSANLIINNCNVLDCYTESPGAGVNAAGKLTMENCCVANNVCAASGAGIFSLSNAIISNSTISHNQSTGSTSMAGGLLVNSGNLEFRNNTLVFNSAFTKGKGIHLNSTQAVANVFYNNIIAANGVPDIGSNYASSFPKSDDIDYNVISIAWAGYIDFGDNTSFNSIGDDTLAIFIDSIALQLLADAGSGVLAHAIDESSLLAFDKGGENSSATDLRNTPRTTPDKGAYEYIANAPMTNISILNIDTTLLLNQPTRIAVSAIPAYTNDKFTLEIDPASEAQAQLNGDTITVSTPGMIKIWAKHISNDYIEEFIVFNALEEKITVNSIGLSLNTSYTSVLPGSQLQFTTNFNPKSGIDTTVTWSVSSEELATITQNGLFTSKAIGTVTVTVTSNANTSISEDMDIKIIDATPVDITINGDYIYKKGIKNPCGAVLCWLTDSDIERPRNRSMETALSEMKGGSLRFPYGALSNNYIWTKDPKNISSGLEPCIAVPSRGPGYWEWAVDEEGYFKKDMDFDEYVALCRKVGAEPVVCVNIMSHVYKQNDDITIDTLIYYAKEWVRYANITKGYDIKYWQLGNEQDHHANIYPLNEFKVDYKEMAEAMHEVDPNIKTSPGILAHWNSDMLYYCPEYVDFITCHQYLWFGGSETEGYSAWKDYGSDLVPHIKKSQDILSSSNSNLEIFVTETGITGGIYPDPQVFNLYKGLILFEMQMEQIISPNVKYTFYWGTHTPWNGEFGDSPNATLFSNDDANENHMQADVLAAINANIQSKYLGKKTLNGIVTYSTMSENDSLLVVFAMNKNDSPKTIKLNTKNIGSFKSFEKLTFAGTSEFDSDTRFILDSEGQIDENLLATTLPPHSISILRTKLNNAYTSVKPAIKDNKVKIYPNPVKDKLHIISETTSDLKVSITSISGRVIKQFHSGSLSAIDVSDLTTGIYVLSIADNKNVSLHKFIKE